jgi:hypothetical protein
MADQFQHISGVAVKVLARLAARKAVKAELKAKAVRGVVPHREIVRATNAHLAANPRLYEQALATAWELSVRDQQGRINAVLFDDYRRGFRKPRRPVCGTGSAKSGTEKTQLFSTTSAIFCACCLLIAC